MPKINKLSLVYISLTVLISLTLCPAALARTSTSTELDVAGWALKGGVFSFLNNLQHQIRYLVTWNPRVKTKMELTKAEESLAVAQTALRQIEQGLENQEKFEEALGTYYEQMSSAFGLLRCQAPELDLILSFLRLLLDVFLDLLFGQAWADTSDEVALNPHLAAPILAFQPRIALKQHFRANALENLGGSGRSNPRRGAERQVDMVRKNLNLADGHVILCRNLSQKLLDFSLRLRVHENTLAVLG